MAFDFYKAAVDDAVEAETEALQSALRTANERIAELERERDEACNRAEELDRNSVDERLYEDLRAQLTAAQEELRAAKETIETYEQVCHDSLPHCVGEWVSGSGGHRKHSGGCGRVATWWQEDDCYAYCDQHKKSHDDYKEASWSGLVHRIAELEVDRSMLQEEVEALCSINPLLQMRNDELRAQFTVALEELRAAIEDVQKERIEGVGRVFREERENES